MGKVLRQERVQEHSKLNSSLCCVCANPILCVSHQRCASSICLVRGKCVSGGMDRREKGAIWGCGGSKPPGAQKSSRRYVTVSANGGVGGGGVWVETPIDRKRQNPLHMQPGCRADLCDTNMGWIKWRKEEKKHPHGEVEPFSPPRDDSGDDTSITGRRIGLLVRPKDWSLTLTLRISFASPLSRQPPPGFHMHLACYQFTLVHLSGPAKGFVCFFFFFQIMPWWCGGWYSLVTREFLV